MKSKLLKVVILLFATIVTISCSKDENSNSTETSSSPSSTIQTFAKFTIATPAGVVKSNYIVMMFDTPFLTNAPLPTIIKQVTSDVNGIANFDLNTIVTSTTAKKYYFEVFVADGQDYVLKTTFSRFDSDFAKGSRLTTTLLVNN